MKLRISHTRLGFSEYVDFQLYKDDLTWKQKQQFGGVRTQKIIEDILIDDYSKFLSLDKLTMYTLLAGYGFAIPRLKATYRTLRPSTVTQMVSPDELESFLRKPENLPVYVKRSFGSYGRGNTLVSGVNHDKVIMGNGKEETISTFVRSLDSSRSLGWMLQEPLKCHAEIKALTGSDKISGLRLHTFLLSDSVVPTKAIFKINVGTRDSDNFEHGASGNMLAAIDMATGRVFRAVTGVGLKQIENPRHPVTGKEIVGFELPYWREVLNLVTNAQKAFPGFICPGWDIALCDDGPKILEVNAFGDIDLSQHAYRTAFIDDEFLELMEVRQLDRLIKCGPKTSKRSSINHRLGIRRHHWQW